jgi:hypothetical protein
VTASGEALIVADTEAAIGARLAALIGVEAGEVDPGAGFFDGSLVLSNGKTVDSMDLVELLLTLEEETATPLMDLTDERGVETISDLARLLVECFGGEAPLKLQGVGGLG